MWKRWMMIYTLAGAGMLLAVFCWNHAVTAAVESTPLPRTYQIMIDPGHGGFDGGATSCSGVLESEINLEISLRLRDMMQLLGYSTNMTRTTDSATNTQGQTIAQRKISDLKERVRMINNTPNAVLLSIHQNTFSDSRYRGAQVFYGTGQGSCELASELQAVICETINPDSKRKSKPSKGVYLMAHADCPAVLIECGFLSNPQEEALLREANYQKKLCCVIGASVIGFLSNT